MEATGWAAAGRRLLAAVPGPRSLWLASQAEHLLLLSLSHLDPEKGAVGIDTRLDAVRARLGAMAASGRERRGDRALLARELRAADAELTRLAPRLPPVRALTLKARLASYTRALEGLPAMRRVGRAGRGREAALLAGTATLGWAALQLPPTAGVGTAAGLVAVGCGAAAVTVGAGLRRKNRKAAFNDALTASDACLPRLSGHLVADLNRQHCGVIHRARVSGRLGADATQLLARISDHLHTLLTRALAEDLDPDVAHLVRASITDYLPDTLDPFLALPDPNAALAGRTAAEELTDQLRSLEQALARARNRPSQQEPATRLLLQGEFLRSKFGQP
jgi:hypothetical protein